MSEFIDRGRIPILNTHIRRTTAQGQVNSPTKHHVHGRSEEAVSTPFQPGSLRPLALVLSCACLQACSCPEQACGAEGAPPKRKSTSHPCLYYPCIARLCKSAQRANSHRSRPVRLLSGINEMPCQSKPLSSVIVHRHGERGEQAGGVRRKHVRFEGRIARHHVQDGKLSDHMPCEASRV